ncbi:MAG: response regulator [Bacteroidota bacterium]
MDMEIKNQTILVVDDEEVVRQTYLEVLAQKTAPAAAGIGMRHRAGGDQAGEGGAGYRLLMASCGAEAIAITKSELAAGHRIAAGFFDMRMPGMDGMETIRQILALDPDVYCAVVTAFSDRSVEQLSTLFTNQDQWLYFNKPFTHAELQQAARNLVNAWNRRRQLEATMAKIEESQKKLKELLG